MAISGKPQGEEEPRVLTFTELKELIETGRLDQIPNNKVIPDALNVNCQYLLEYLTANLYVNSKHHLANQRRRHERNLGKLHKRAKIRQQNLRL